MSRDMDRGEGQKRESRRGVAYVLLSDEELAFVDRSLREGKLLGEISKELGYRDVQSFNDALTKRGFKRGACLVGLREGEKDHNAGASSISSEEMEFLEVTEAFKGKRRATVALVALLLKLLVKYCDLYTFDYPQYTRKADRERGL